jgi:hypothetical protein
MPRTTAPRKQPAKKRALTAAQRAAVDRRVQERQLRESLADIETRIRDERYIPMHYRAKVAQALNVILHGGHPFVLACAKAYLTRTWRKWDDAGEFWAFIDAQNALFERTMVEQWNEPDMVASWNAPDYELSAEDTRTVS